MRHFYLILGAESVQHFLRMLAQSRYPRDNTHRAVRKLKWWVRHFEAAFGVVNMYHQATRCTMRIRYSVTNSSIAGTRDASSQ